ncbi:hypothetical protein CHLRE_07g322376v5 [Chlamydomonas reinhardtii]|uniref:Uncharacterized protein n=1 Tax=Chlamydomonas reinhardtii TaxID=3055 RepID=A0A2K3DJ47_CHLRE|nr:uncharacterized protein CHLRE_07g322376v5 [Chlamydomonas reinhardtii]PNW80552.1 hypothetical protein CHLRE_07g322376v5 [Chlamydomonas reinhardtii]
MRWRAAAGSTASMPSSCRPGSSSLVLYDRRMMVGACRMRRLVQRGKRPNGGHERGGACAQSSAAPALSCTTSSVTSRSCRSRRSRQASRQPVSFVENVPPKTSSRASADSARSRSGSAIALVQGGSI